MVTDPFVSVILPAYNATRFIGAAIESVLAQTYSRLELIVVDDGSTDSTASIVRGYRDRVRYIYQENARQAAARNNGLRHATGDLMAFIDADDIWLPQKLEKQVALFKQNPDLGLVYCSLREIDAEGNPLRDLRADLRGHVLERVLLGKFSGGGTGSTSLIPRKVLETVGDFDMDLPPCEDTDLLWRIASRYPIDCVDEVLVLYRLHGGNAHANVKIMTQAWKRLYAKALRNPHVQRLGWRFHRQCYGRLYYMLAGDHAHAGQWINACQYGLYSILWWPPNLLKIMGRMVRFQRYLFLT
jgi:glycosyltransferase involved in cell wall biosynthesis